MNVEEKLRGYVKTIAKMNNHCRTRAEKAAQLVIDGDIERCDNHNFRVKGRYVPYYTVARHGWACGCFDYLNDKNNRITLKGMRVCKHTIAVMMHVKLCE